MVGFLKFLKREKKEALDELDLPPEPPPLEGFEENLPELPDFPDFEKEISAPAQEELPKFEQFEDVEKMPDFEKDALDFPSYPEEEKPIEPIPSVNAPAVSEPEPSMPEPMISQPEPGPEQPAGEEPRFMPLEHPKIGRRLFAHEKKVLRERSNVKTIYVRVDRFKATLGSINIARSDIRKSEEALIKMENIKNSKDRAFDKFKASLEDLQKKLIFVDKTLFKGGE